MSNLRQLFQLVSRLIKNKRLALLAILCCLSGNNQHVNVANSDRMSLSAIIRPASPPAVSSREMTWAQRLVFPSGSKFGDSDPSPPSFSGQFDEHKGFVGFSVPKVMVVGKTDTISAGVIRSRLKDELLKTYPNFSEDQIENALISSRMKASLYSVPGGAFDIEPNFETAIRSVLDNRATTWEWSVTPKKPGSGVLSLHIITISRVWTSTEEGPSWVKKFSFSIERSELEPFRTKEAQSIAAETPAFAPAASRSPLQWTPGGLFTEADIKGKSGRLPPDGIDIEEDGTESSLLFLIGLSWVSLWVVSVFIIGRRFNNSHLRMPPQHGSLNTRVAIKENEIIKLEPPQKKEILMVQNRPIRSQIKILFLSANPRATNAIRLDEEVREIQTWLSRAQYECTSCWSNAHEYLELATEWAVRVSDLPFLLQKHRPHILHFSGHGVSSSEIILEDQAGAPILVPAEALNKLLSILKDNIRCVVLNACYTEQQASGIAQAVDCVVGMSRVVQDRTAIQFAAAFYQALAFGRTLKQAFALGQVQAQLIGQQDHDVPRLITRVGVDADAVRFIE